MRRTAATLGLVFCAALLFGGCFGSQAKKHYYRAYYRPQTARVVPVPATARVKTLEIDKVYRRYNLVYRTSPYEIFYYPNHYWASRPEDMMTDLVYAHLKVAGLFTDLIVKLDKTPDYEVTGEIREIDMFDSGDRWFAHLSMVLTLKDFKTGAVLAAHPFDERREVFGREPVHTVRAIGEIAEQEIERFIQHIAAELGKK
ncbi:MAG TPA: ABC-type transport auxiliary lipoprotein family protein [bacterium]|nr:ABC-type transport auxiliary lipoprotein family protein [bacterium]